MNNIFTNDDIDFSLYMRETDVQAKVKPAKSYLQGMKDRLLQKRHEVRIRLPWECARNDFHFRPGEVTVWAGQSGHGKSQITAQVALSLMAQGQKVLFASFELKPEVNLQRLAMMFIGQNPFSPEFQEDEGIQAVSDLYDEFIEATESKLFFYDHKGSIEGEKIVAMARYCAKEKGINHIIVDNLAKCIRNEDDYNGQKAFVDDMTLVAQDYGVHIHLVHHLKKPPKETDRPDKSDVKGSGSIVDQPDNLFLVWRNKAKEDERKEVRSEAMRKRQGDPDQLLLCKKQRNHDGLGEGEPSILLWYHRDSGQYLESPNQSPRMFINPWPHSPSDFHA